jgi:phosphoribosylpyrophosphate synthetase
MNRFTIQPDGHYLIRPGNIDAYYNCDYTGMGNPGNPDFLNHLKNQNNDFPIPLLQQSVNTLASILQGNLTQIKNNHQNANLTICVIPRAKAEICYHNNQKLFRSTVSCVVQRIAGCSDGTSYIIRHTTTRTTHLAITRRHPDGNIGDLPYPGIAKDTCNISNAVTGKDVLLIDDIYTAGVNIDEDAIQALFDNGANNIYFYAVGKTI